MIVKNLWAKELKAGDLIVDVKPVDSKWGEINRFTVERATPAGLEEALATVKAAIA